MDLRAVMSSARAAWSDAHVLGVARQFLTLCGWSLEVGDGIIEVPMDAELRVISWALIFSQDGFGDHAVAIVYLGLDKPPRHDLPLHGVLRLYLNADGQMITEDRYSPTQSSTFTANLALLSNS